MYSAYDKLKNEHFQLKRKRITFLLAFSCILSLLILFLFSYLNKFIMFIIFLILTIVFSISLDFLLSIIFKKYNTNRCKEKIKLNEIKNLKSKMNKIINSTNQRKKGMSFKKSFNFIFKEIKEFEHILSIAMHKERKEVWVTAFFKDNVVRKINATIGSLNSCKPSDDIANWLLHFKRLNCDKIRQYHNHLVYKNFTSPSNSDLRSEKYISEYLKKNGIILESYIVFYNDICEYRILKYSENESEIVNFFDVSLI